MSFKNSWHFFFGALLVGLCMALLVVTGQFEFVGFGEFNGFIIVLGLMAYVIQGTTEELMTRGFLQNRLYRRIKISSTILISTIVFILPHIASLTLMGGLGTVISLINLVLISILFSLTMIKDNSVASACGIHVGWNFVLAVIFGLQVSGGDSVNGVLQFAMKSNNALITGGNYGIEASVILIPILIFIDILYASRIKRR